MNTAQDLELMLGYNEWADQIVLAGARQLTPLQLTEKHGMGYGSAFETLVHIMAAQHIWLSRWKGEAPSPLLDASHFAGLDHLASEWATVHSDLRQYIMALPLTELHKTITYYNLRGESYSNPLMSLFLHAMNHGTEHRSQVAAVCAKNGIDVGSLDMITYIRRA